MVMTDGYDAVGYAAAAADDDICVAGDDNEDLLRTVYL